ncbi:MAG: nucleotidyltransferase domain-containing protein [Thermoproteales archaeon]|nr:nucleotidyltransferase domain-containing protein [Thermoproteales archaeon]
MRELELVIKKLRNRFRVYAIILFGSRARGDWMPWSDYDLLIIADFELDYLDRIGEILEVLADVKLPIEPHPYTLEEVIKMLNRANPLIIDALEEGKLLFSTKEFELVNDAYCKLKRKGISRTKTTIKLSKT